MNNKTLKSILHWFCQEISLHYSKEEAQSLFFRMMEDALGYSKTQVLSNYDTIISSAEIDQITAIIARLKTNEPIQYILEKTFFYNLPFIIKPGILIPRSETEELVHMIIQENKQKQAITIVDIGTGSGCIPICLAKYLPNAIVHSIDISEDCIAIARQNAALNGAAVQLIQADILNNTSISLFDKIDIIVSNPPYVLDSEKALIKPNVLQYEPHLALFVPDNNPLLFYKSILDKAVLWLNNEGLIYFEINEQYGQSLCNLALELGFSSAIVLHDIYEKDRFVKIRK